MFKKVEQRPEKAKSKRHIEKTLVGVSLFFKVSAKTATTWNRQGMPGEHGEWDLSAIAVWRDKRKSAASAGSEKDELECERLRIGNKRAELRLKRERGELVLRSLVKAEFEQHISATAARMEAIPDELGSSIPAEFRADVVSDMKQKFDTVRREFAGFDLQEGKPRKSKSKQRLAGKF